MIHSLEIIIFAVNLILKQYLQFDDIQIMINLVLQLDNIYVYNENTQDKILIFNMLSWV